jgi:hypothetical protein
VKYGVSSCELQGVGFLHATLTNGMIHHQRDSSQITLKDPNFRANSTEDYCCGMC